MVYTTTVDGVTYTLDHGSVAPQSTNCNTTTVVQVTVIEHWRGIPPRTFQCFYSMNSNYCLDTIPNGCKCPKRCVATGASVDSGGDFDFHKPIGGWAVPDDGVLQGTLNWRGRVGTNCPSTVDVSAHIFDKEILIYGIKAICGISNYPPIGNPVFPLPPGTPTPPSPPPPLPSNALPLAGVCCEGIVAPPEPGDAFRDVQLLMRVRDPSTGQQHTHIASVAAL